MTDPEIATLKLANGQLGHATREQLEHVAASMAEGDGTRLEAEIGSRSVEVMPLLVKVFNTEPDMVRRRHAVDLLHALDFHLVGEDSLVEVPDEPVKVELPAAEEDDLVGAPDITPQLAINLQRFAGSWVALHSGHVLGVDESLRSLINQIGDVESTVPFVPRRGANRDVRA